MLQDESRGGLVQGNKTIGEVWGENQAEFGPKRCTLSGFYYCNHDNKGPAHDNE